MQIASSDRVVAIKPAVPNLLHLISHLVQAQSRRFPLMQPLNFCFIFAAWGSVVSSGAPRPKTNLGHITRRRTPVVEGKSDIL